MNSKVINLEKTFSRLLFFSQSVDHKYNDALSYFICFQKIIPEDLFSPATTDKKDCDMFLHN